MANQKYIITEDGKKSCTKCGEFKLLSEFSPRKNKNGGYYTVGSSRCRKCNNSECNQWAHDNKTYNIKRGKTYRLAKRKKVIDYYGSICACCKESQYEFLSIDHINGKGTQHRISLGQKGRGQSFISWLIKEGLPEGYRVLCHNCNFAMGIYGQCPHQENYDFSLYLEK